MTSGVFQGKCESDTSLTICRSLRDGSIPIEQFSYTAKPVVFPVHANPPTVIGGIESFQSKVRTAEAEKQRDLFLTVYSYCFSHIPMDTLFHAQFSGCHGDVKRRFAVIWDP